MQLISYIQLLYSQDTALEHFINFLHTHNAICHFNVQLLLS